MNSVITTPTTSSDRAEILDVLRGFAILGIFMANIAVFSGYVFLDPSQKATLITYRFDRWIDYVYLALVHGKFYSLFSLLFGIGFSILITRNHFRSNSFRVFYRRLIILVVFGLLHSFFLWDGDILLLYALIAFLLPVFTKTTDRTLLVAAALLLISPIFIDLLKLTFAFMPGKPLIDIGLSLDKQNGIPQDQSVAYYLFQSNAGYSEVLNWNEAGFFYRYGTLLNNNRIPKVLAIFILGFYVGKKSIHVQLAENKTLLESIRLHGFLLGIPFGIALAFFETDKYVLPNDSIGILDTITYFLSVVPLCLAYASSFCLLWLKPSGERILRIIAPAGRMALTNYIMQSLIGILLFYNVGFGLGLKFGPSVSIPIAITIYVLQVIFSNFWLRHFNFGPLEWIWRQFTYGKQLPLRKSASIPQSL